MEKKISISILIILLIGFNVGCGNQSALDPKNPVTLTLWHSYVEPTRGVMDNLVDEFNQTVGAQRGIIVNTSLVADTYQLNEKLMTAVNKDPGAPALPDIAVVYPNIAVKLAEKGLLIKQCRI